jgi:hypothetical protein
VALNEIRQSSGYGQHAQVEGVALPGAGPGTNERMTAFRQSLAAM